MYFLFFSHYSYSFECVSDIVSVLIIFSSASWGGQQLKIGIKVFLVLGL